MADPADTGRPQPTNADRPIGRVNAVIPAATNADTEMRKLDHHLWRPAAFLLVATSGASCLVATLLTLWGPSDAAFLSTTVRSLCIGLSILCIGLLSWLFPGTRPPVRPTALAAVFLVAVPVGYAVGMQISDALLQSASTVGGALRRPHIALIATILTSAFLAYLLFVRERLARESDARARLQQLATEAELRFLQAQLEPHMLFNTLANLRSLVEVDLARSQSMIDAMITYYRGALESTRRGIDSTLEAEFVLLQAYMDIMSLRMGPRLTVRLSLPDTLRGARLPAMLLQPLVENAIKHGLELKVGPVTLDVEATRVDGGFTVAVADSGLGWIRSERESEPSSGYGLTHVRERLQTRFGAAASLTITPNHPTGTRVTVKVVQ